MNRFNFLLSGTLSALGYIIGGLDSLIITLVIVIGIDYLTGICQAIILKKVSSTIGLKGILKKFGYLMIVALATLMDYLLHDKSMAIRTLVIYFFIANESISILENWSLIGLPLPKKLYQVFENIKNEERE